MNFTKENLPPESFNPSLSKLLLIKGVKGSVREVVQTTISTILLICRKARAWVSFSIPEYCSSRDPLFNPDEICVLVAMCKGGFLEWKDGRYFVTDDFFTLHKPLRQV